MSEKERSWRAVPPPVTGFGVLNMPPMEDRELASGAKLHVLNQGQLDVCRVCCLVPGGIAEAENAVLPRLLLSMFQEGTCAHPGVKLAETIEFDGASVQTGLYPHYMLVGINMLNSKADKVIPLLKEMLFTPELASIPFETCIDRLTQSVELMEKRVEYMASKALTRLSAGQDHPLARTMSASQIRGVELDSLYQWHKYACAHASGMHIYIGGNVTDGLVSLVEGVFDNYGVPGKSMPFNIVPFAPQVPQRLHVPVEGALQCAVRMTAPAIPRSNPDYIGLRLLVMALGGYFGSRLMMNIREDKGYTYGISASLNGQPEGSFVEIAASTDAVNVEPLIEETLKEIAAMSSGNFTVDEVERLKSFATSQLASMLDTPFDMIDYHVTLQAASITQPDYFRCQYNQIRKLTPGLLTELARKYLNPDEFSVVIAG